MTEALGVNLEPGVVLAGKYRIERVIGQGGMGIVAAAHHLHLDQRVALKLMLPHAMGSKDAVSRFLREARAAARISSEHVARVFDVGAIESGEPYIAMEYLEGTDLAQLLASRGRLPLGEAVEYLLQACEALSQAHAAGIVHRDLKPGNLFLAHRIDGQTLVKVLDFGISKMTGAALQSQAPLTRTAALMGSPLYMSPEQMGSSKSVDARSDVWSLGVVLYEMLGGAPPFDGETLPQVCGMVLSEEPRQLATRAPGLPPLAYAVVERCLRKPADARYQSIAELAQALEPLSTPRARQSIERILRVQGVVPSGVASAVVPSGTVVTSAVQAVSAPSLEPSIHQPKAETYAPLSETKPPRAEPRKRGLSIALGLGVLVLLGGGFAAQLFKARTDAEPLAASASGAQLAAVPPIAATRAEGAVAEPSPSAATSVVLATPPEAAPAASSAAIAEQPAPAAPRAARPAARAASASSPSAAAATAAPTARSVAAAAPAAEPARTPVPEPAAAPAPASTQPVKRSRL